MKIRVAIPCHDGKVFCQTAMALFQEFILCARAGISMEVSFLPGGSEVALARNVMVHEFLTISDADKLVWIDSDVSWAAGDLVRLVSHDVDLIGGAYRHKREEESYPAFFLPGETKSDPETGLLPMRAVPGGFLCVKRSVFDVMRKAFPHDGFAHPFGDPRVKMHPFYHVPRGGSEDGNFCDEWREAGGTVWLDPDLTLTHSGGVPSYTGNIREWIARTNGQVDVHSYAKNASNGGHNRHSRRAMRAGGKR